MMRNCVVYAGHLVIMFESQKVTVDWVSKFGRDKCRALVGNFLVHCTLERLN
jgi:hypothetical protein